MTANVGTFDRMLRVVLGVVLALAAQFSGLGLFDATVVKYGVLAVGLVLVLTGAFRFCPLYSILGIRTCKA